MTKFQEGVFTFFKSLDEKALAWIRERDPAISVAFLSAKIDPLADWFANLSKSDADEFASTLDAEKRKNFRRLHAFADLSEPFRNAVFSVIELKEWSPITLAELEKLAEKNGSQVPTVVDTLRHLVTELDVRGWHEAAAEVRTEISNRSN